MEVFSDLPGVQFYSGNFLKGEKGKNGAIYEKRQGFCLETQYFPNAIRVGHFLSSILKKDKEYHSRTIYKFGMDI
ncbi:aldose 1-epimerase [Anaerobium acetethylicum]|uniref:Aldose 1-epimerase n=2 Tax=Anaerobium acetethylicum TaxID=1619234 RepID=A0A1D3TV58_9FIRM|nr:aldose 1-epimerase [Anaerobium acetethylicum]